MDNSIIIGKSKVSHGTDSNRVYLMDMHPDDFPNILNTIDQLAKEECYTKIFAKLPVKYAPAFLKEGYVTEAFIPKLFNGSEDAVFMMYYTDNIRMQPEYEALTSFQQILLKPAKIDGNILDDDYSIRPLTIKDTKQMVCVFKKVFESYPFPIFEEDFLIKSMLEDGTRYFGARFNDNLIAICSAECNDEKEYAEMTDFAVLPKHRGKRLAIHLLSFMEQMLIKENFKTFYTIARLHSLSMNKTFYNLGYHYSGTLHNNTQISGKIESMNVWYKNVI